MAFIRPAFTVGIEEEYLVVDTTTRDLVNDPPPEFMSSLESILGGQVSPEFLRAQVEIGTKVCASIPEAREDLVRLRSEVSLAAKRHGYAIIAASTHPFARWQDQKTTDKERYNMLERDMQAVLRRLVISGMHVHVGIEDEEVRIDLMNQIKYFVPHLFALSTSSPFWGGEVTGLKSYRKSVFKALPRTGLPPYFDSWDEYQRHVNVLTGPGVIEDATRLWWDIRPSARYATLELRIADICTDIEDGLTIAALYQSLLAMLYRQRTNNQKWRQYTSMLIDENIWRAQRYGISESLMDYGRGELVPFADLVDELVDLVSEDAKELGCVAEVEHARTIAARGTSADRQLSVYESAMADGRTEQEALRDVVDYLVEGTSP